MKRYPTMRKFGKGDLDMDDWRSPAESVIIHHHELSFDAMQVGYAGFVLLAVFLLSAGVPAMSNSAHETFGRCAVLGADKLPPGSGGADAICAEVERAIAAGAPGARYKTEIRVLSPSRLSATVIVDGRTLPVQNFAVMDRNLSGSSIKHFADSLAAVVVQAAKP